MARAADSGAFAGRFAVVVGAGGQIGRHLMTDLEQRGATVVGLDLERACPPGDERYVPCDITDETQVASVFQALTDRTQGIDLLIHSAGLSAIGRFEDHDVATHRRVLEVTHLGPVSCTLAALPALRQARGRIVVIGSVAGFAPVLGRPAYVAAKHAVTGLFTSLRPELAADGISVTICHPTFVTGGMSEAAPRADGSTRLTTGGEVSAADVSAALLDGVADGAELILVGRTARLAWQASRHAPGLYARLMARRLRTGSSVTARRSG